MLLSNASMVNREFIRYLIRALKALLWTTTTTSIAKQQQQQHQQHRHGWQNKLSVMIKAFPVDDFRFIDFFLKPMLSALMSLSHTTAAKPKIIQSVSQIWKS